LSTDFLDFRLAAEIALAHMKMSGPSSIKRHFSIILWLVITLLLILLVIWMTDRMITRLNQAPPQVGYLQRDLIWCWMVSPNNTCQFSTFQNLFSL